MKTEKQTYHRRDSLRMLKSSVKTHLKKAFYFYNCIQEFHKSLSQLFYKLGYLIAKHPAYFITFPIFIAIIGLSGFQKINYESDPEYLFTPTNGKGRLERTVVEALFPINYADAFDAFRITRPSPFISVKILARDDGGIFKVGSFTEITALDAAVRTQLIEYEGDSYNYTDICAKMYGSCIENKVLNLNELMLEIEKGAIQINYPVMLFPLVVPFYLGGVIVNETEGVITEAKAVSLYYWLKNDSNKQRERSYLFEKKVLGLLEETEFEHIRVARIASRSLTDEIDRNIQSVTPYLIYLVLLMAAFSVGSLFTFDWVRMKLLIGLLGIVSATLGTACSFGFLMYLGVPFIGINMAAPFLMLGIGLDDMFVILSAWNRTPIHEEVPVRLAKAYSEAAVSVTITSLTSVLSFFLGTITPFPAVKIFCIYTGCAGLFTYIWFITFFGGCLAVAGGHESKNKHNVSCQPAVAKSVAGNYGCCFRIWCTGGYNPEDPWNPEDNQPHPMMTFFRDYLGNALNRAAVKVSVVFAFILYLSGAIYGCTQVSEGLDLTKLALDDSYTSEYFKVEDTLFRKYPYAVQVIINDDLTYSDPVTKRSVLELHETFENLDSTAAPILTQSWMRGFYKFLDRRRYNVTTEKEFIQILKLEYLTPNRKSPEFLDVKFNEDETQITASRFIIHAYNTKNSYEDRDLMIKLRKIASDAPFNVVVYNLFFLVFDQFLLVKNTCVQTIIIASVVMMIVSLIFIPNPLCSLWVAFSIISIEVGVIGYMSLWGISLDTISMINLIMCVGFSVDFSAHISYSFITSEAETSGEKVKECLFNMGLPILQGGLSTITGVLILVTVPSYLFNTFFKMNFLIITFGLLHSLFLLPVMLSILRVDSRTGFVDQKSSNLLIELSKQEVISENATKMKPNDLANGTAMN